MKSHKIGMGTMIAVCVGVVIVQGAMIASLEGIGVGGLSFVSALLIAYLLAVFNAMSFSELALMYPEAGSLATYTKKAMGDFPAIVAVFSGYVVVAMLGIPVEMFLIDAMVYELFGDKIPAKIIPITILCFFTWTNYLGMDLFAKIQNILSFSMMFAVFLLGLTALGLISSTASLDNIASTFNMGDFFSGNVIGLLAMALWLMLGVEFLCPMINVLKNPVRNLPRAMFLSLTILLVMFMIFTFGGAYFLTPENTASNTPLLYLDYARAVFGENGLIIAAVMAFTATCSTVNTVLASIPRMLQGMAENGQAFPQMKVMSKHDTPILGIGFIALCILIPLLLFNVDSLITFVISASISWLLAYIINHINVIILRKTQPNLPRPYKTPFYPIPQIVGIIGMAYVVINNAPTSEQSLQVLMITGSILAVISVISFVWVKLFMKKPLFSTQE